MLKLPWEKIKPVRAVLILAMTAAVAVAAVFSYRAYDKYAWKRHVRQQAEAKLLEEVNVIQKILVSIEQIPLNLAYVMEFSGPRSEHIHVLLESVVANNDEVFGASIAFEPRKYDQDTIYFAPYLYKKDHDLIWVDPADTTNHYFSQDWYLIPKTLQKPVWIEPYFDEGSSGGNIVMTTYSVPFYSYDGKHESFMGIVAVDISIDWLSNIVDTLKLGDGGYSILVSENGTVISAPNRQWPYNESLYSLAEEMDLPVLREIGRDLKNGKSGFRHAGTMGTDQECWIYYMPIPANNWGVLLVVPEMQKK